jgi:hypothetical protein
MLHKIPEAKVLTEICHNCRAPDKVSMAGASGAVTMRITIAKFNFLSNRFATGLAVATNNAKEARHAIVKASPETLTQ